MNRLIDPNALKAKLAAIEAEAIGWLPLEEEKTGKRGKRGQTTFSARLTKCRLGSVQSLFVQCPDARAFSPTVIRCM
ncbi:hypothetical protein [Allochromatium tepidum]|uniref:hypothetical protein n=1 Tax=Allochromatium tepidum TaxID=553982 RepID=UPI001BCD2B61|nr:hypothetical protein [Allochromatium tepidum]